ncbi:MAG TPA: hypothetical protein VFD05_01305 [Bacilli bacterium]|nr:hypothetical protein [Bacilli bacterium]
MNEKNNKDTKTLDIVKESNKVEKVAELDVLDKYRNKFVKEINIVRYISYGVAALTIAIVIVSYMVLMPLNAWAGIVPVIIALIGAGAFSFFSRRNQETKIQKYMSDYNDVINRHLTADFTVNDYFYDYRDGLKTKTFAQANILEDVTESASRNLNSYSYKDYKISNADFVAYKRDGKRLSSVFAGKLFSTTRTKNVKNQVILYLKPNKEVFKESGEPEIKHLEVAEDNDNYRIYATGKYKTVLPQKALDEILKIERNDVLADLTVSIVDNTVTVLLSYGKDIIAVPYKEPVPHLAIRKYIKDIGHILNFLDLI